MGKINILVADDHKLIRQGIKNFLEVQGEFDVSAEAETGEEAISTAEKIKPDIIIMDLNMPRMGGVEFMEIVKTDDALKRIPVIILTTSKAEQDRVKTFNLGLAGYIIKPVDHDNFIEMMDKIHQYWELSLFPEDY